MLQIKRLKPKYKIFSAILLGFLLYGIKAFAEILFHPLQGTLALIGLLLIFGSPFAFRAMKNNPLHGNTRTVYYLFLIWILFIILRPLFLGQSYSEDTLHPYAVYGLLSYLLPLIVLLGTRLISIPKIFQIVFIFSIIGLFYFILNFRNMQQIVMSGVFNSEDGKIGINNLANNYYYWFNISALSLLCYEFIPQKYKLMAILTTIFLLVLMLYFARRGGVFMILLYFIGMFYLYVFQTSKGSKPLKFFFVISVFVTGWIVVMMNSNNIFSLFFDRMSGFNLNDNSRTGVEMAAVNFITKQKIWLIGGGIEARYWAPGFDAPRYGVETGYMNMILKGGIVYLALYVYLLLHAAYRGWFKSNNNLMKAFSLYIVFHVIFLIPYGIQSFDLEYLFLWITVAFTESVFWRNMTNKQVKDYLKLTA